MILYFNLIDISDSQEIVKLMAQEGKVCPMLSLIEGIELNDIRI
jgi:hypothetical protein